MNTRPKKNPHTADIKSLDRCGLKQQYHIRIFSLTRGGCTAVLKGKGAQSQEIDRFARLYATYFYLNPLVL